MPEFGCDNAYRNNNIASFFPNISPQLRNPPLIGNKAFCPPLMKNYSSDSNYTQITSLETFYHYHLWIAQVKNDRLIHLLRNYEFYRANLGGNNHPQNQPPPISQQQHQAIASDDARMQHFINSCLQGIDEKIKPINDSIQNLSGEVGSLNQRLITQE